MQTQLEKLYEVYQSEPDPLRKNIFLSDLQNRNETLFFRLLINHMEEMGTLWPLGTHVPLLHPSESLVTFSL